MFHSEPEIAVGTTGFTTKAEDGTSFDLLGRKASGERLSALVDRLSAPTVIALDGAWGSGKSHFLKLWCGAHCHENAGKSFPVYFDAFAEDYLDDPLLSLVAAIDRVTSKTGDTAKPSILSRLRRAAGPLTRSFVRIGLAVGTAGVSEAVGAVGDAAAAAVSDEGKDMLDGFWNRERGRAEALSAFQTALADLAATRPIVLIVDELDRCRPDYALSLLEIAKHSFAVPGVHFILGVNLEALEHSVRKRYGTGIDASLYLQKFYSLRMSLPDAESANLRNWAKILHRTANNLNLHPDLLEETKTILQSINVRTEISFRDVKRICSRLSLFSPQIAIGQTPASSILICAAILETLFPAHLAGLRSGH